MRWSRVVCDICGKDKPLVPYYAAGSDSKVCLSCLAKVEKRDEEFDEWVVTPQEIAKNNERCGGL